MLSGNLLSWAWSVFLGYHSSAWATSGAFWDSIWNLPWWYFSLSPSWQIIALLGYVAVGGFYAAVNDHQRRHRPIYERVFQWIFWITLGPAFSVVVLAFGVWLMAVGLFYSIAVFGGAMALVFAFLLLYADGAIWVYHLFVS